MSRQRTSLPRLGLMLVIRYTPAPWSWKRELIRLLQPKLGATGVAVIPDGEGRVLLLRARYSGRWLLPGGALHAGENPRAGTERECREELGREVRLERLTGVYADADERQIWFAFLTAPLAAPPLLSEEHDAFRYALPGAAEFPASLIAGETLTAAAELRIATLPHRRGAGASRR